MYGAQRVREYLLADIQHNRLTLSAEPNDVGYAVSREPNYDDSFSFAALPDVPLAADPFLDPRSTA